MYSVSDIMTISCGDDRELSREFSPVLTLISWFLDSVMVENVFSKEGLKPGMKETLADTSVSGVGVGVGGGGVDGGVGVGSCAG